MFKGGSTEGCANHVGIYLGDNQWIHCSSSADTVVVEDNIQYFKYFVRVDFQETSEEEYREMLRIANDRIVGLNKTIEEAEKYEEEKKTENLLGEELRKLIWEKQERYKLSKEENIMLFGIGIVRPK